MSAEKKAQSKAERAEKRRQEELKDRRSTIVYTVVAVLVVLAAVVLMFWRSGILQRSLTALNVNGVKYTSVDVQYYYNNLYSQSAQYYLFDSTTSVKRQTYDEATGQSWYDYLIEQAVEQMVRNTALAQQAQAEGYTLSEEAQDAVNSTLTQLETAWMTYGYTSRDAFIRASFGANMTYDRLVSLLNQEYLASDYAQHKLEDIDHPESDYQAYYQEHADQMDTVTYSQITFRAYVSTVDEAGNTIEMTDEEKAAALEALKPDLKATAEEVQAKLESGEDFASLVEEYGDQLYGSSDGRRSTYDSLYYLAYGDWLVDSARQKGDITLLEEDTGTTYYCYVVRYEDRELDQEQTHTVRHLLVSAGDSTTTDPTQEQYDEAEQKAQELLDEWKSGEATEDSFAALVTANSDDTGSASSGGLISNITSTSSYVETFRAWAIDPARREGDVELVKSEYGWHIMYYVSTDEPIWRQNTASALMEQDYEEMTATATQGWSVTRGFGMNFVSA